MDEIERIVAPAFYCVIAVVGILGNGIVLYVMTVLVETKSVTDVYVTNLAAADLLFVSTLPFWAVELIWNNWVFGGVMCKLLSAILYINMYGSIFFLTAMGVDRWIAVVRAIASRKVRTVQRTRIIIGAIWAVCLLSAIFPLVFRSVIEADSNRNRCVWNFPKEYRSHLNIFYTLSRTLLGFLIPLIILMVCYLSIITFMIKRSKAKGKKYKGMSRITKMIALVILCFVIAWLPNQITNFIHFMSLIGSYKYCDSSYEPQTNIQVSLYTEQNDLTSETLMQNISQHRTTESFAVITTSPTSYRSYLNPINDAANKSYQLHDVATYAFNESYSTTTSFESSDSPISACFRRIQILHLITVCLGFANSVMNPIVYTCMGSTLRKKMRLVFKCCRGDRSFRQNKFSRARTLSTYLRSTVLYMNGDATKRTSRKQQGNSSVTRTKRSRRKMSSNTSDPTLSIHGSAILVTSLFTGDKKTKIAKPTEEPQLELSENLFGGVWIG